MQEYFHFTENPLKLQKQLKMILGVVEKELVKLESLFQRKNRHLLKQSDGEIISVHILGKLLGFYSERSWHRFIIGNLFERSQFPERSRYNRRCRDLLQMIKWIRYRIVQSQPVGAYTIIDSLPIPLCHNVRIPRIKRFKGVADRGYCASKKTYFYGFKAHIQVTNKGLITSYVISPSSYHDVEVTEDLIAQNPHPVTLGDKGYISQTLKQNLQETYSVSLWTPLRSNSKQPVLPKVIQIWMRQKRKRIETIFSVLVEHFLITSIRANSLTGFETSLEAILMAHTLWITGAVEL
ncbi:IS982 family transposase [Bacillus taeanensis]|uniref:IS982 family transposase n=1 Tax=Bacillus taeanensis TaxID=273032 RepID=A0A366XUP4_9BACI|nr:IS982 family transposase [Bacillus taeanensis]RBW68865.1 IS982 family transposase [Bacillus taeanensis]